MTLNLDKTYGFQTGATNLRPYNLIDLDTKYVPLVDQGKVKVDIGDNTAGYLADKLIADTDPAGKETIVFTKHGNDGTSKTYGAMVDINNVYDEIIDKMNPPSYDLFGAYPDEVGVCQLTGIGAALRAKSLKDSNGAALSWTHGVGQNGANYGRSCVPGYAYVKTATGTKVRKRVWCAFGSTGEIYNSFDRYQSTTHDNSLVIADSTYSRIPAGNSGLSCAAYIKDGTDYYWFVGGFIDNYIYLLHDVADSYNDDGTFKSTAWIWTACPTLPANIAHICSVKTGGFLYTGYQLGGAGSVYYKASIAGAGTLAISNQPRLNADIVKTVIGDGSTTEYDLPCLAHQSYNSPSAIAKDSNGNTLEVNQVIYIQNTNSFAVYLRYAPANGLSVTITVSSYQYNASYTGAGFSGVGSDHYGTYNVIDRDTGRIYTNTSEALSGTFTPTSFTLLPLYVRDSETSNYPTTTSDRLGTRFGSILPNDPYTWWSGIQSAYGLWVATIALKQYTDDPIYAYSDDGIHWTKYTDGIGTGTSSTIAIWDSQSDGMNWYVTNMYSASPLIFELLVNSIPSHKRLVCEKGLGVSGDAFLVDLPSTNLLGTDENGKIIPVSVTTVSNLKAIYTYPKALIQDPIVISPDQWTMYWTSIDLDNAMILSPTSKFSAILGQVGLSNQTFNFVLGEYDDTNSNYKVLAYSNNVSLLTAGVISGLCDSLTGPLTLSAGKYYLGFETNSNSISIAGLTASALFNDISPRFLSLKHPNLTTSTVPATFSTASETLTRFYIKLEA